MFKLPGLPSPQADVHELADFAELLSWQRGQVSEREILAYLGRVDDNDDNVGCNDDDDENALALDEVMNEIDRRAVACESGYPFQLHRSGTVLEFNAVANDNARSIVYLYLLLSTRLNMKSNRIHAGIDGANLLEPLSAKVLRNYLGQRARSLVFGTSMAGSFEERVGGLCRELGEGAGFESLDGNPVYANDDKLDAVAWIPFSDRLAGQVAVFAQCKTGTTWQELRTQLQPSDFVKRWFRKPLLVDPLRAFCISEAIPRATWKESAVYSGILFDRCRLVDFCDDIDTTDIRKWTDAAKASFKL